MESSQGVDAGVGSGTETACTRFNEALDLAAITYSDFADVTAGDQWEYRDPVVHDANITSRTALRTAAATALGASATEGLHPDVAAQMRGWSLGAGKLGRPHGTAHQRRCHQSCRRRSEWRHQRRPAGVRTETWSDMRHVEPTFNSPLAFRQTATRSRRKASHRHVDQVRQSGSRVCDRDRRWRADCFRRTPTRRRGYDRRDARSRFRSRRCAAAA